MHKHHIVAGRIHKSVNMNIAVRLLHVINIHTHSLQFVFYLFESALVAAYTG